MILETLLLTSLYFECGENVHPEVLHSIVKTESAQNPYVIANVTDGTSLYLDTKEEAISKANELKESGKKYSVGLMQIYSENFNHYDLNNENAFDYCQNIKTGAKILKACYKKSEKENPDFSHDAHLENAMSCYYRGNFSRGFKKDEGLNTSYVERIRNNQTSIFEIPSFYNYSKFEFKEGNLMNNTTKRENQNEIFINQHWDVFNDYEKL